MGVIHVITNDGRVRQDNEANGFAVSAWSTFGGPQTNFKHFNDTSKLVDTTVAYTGRGFRVRLSTRLESSVMDTDTGKGFVFTSPAIYTSATAWGTGTLAAYPTLAGAFHSPDQKAAVDARLYVGKGTELAGQFLNLSTGFGTVYSGDRHQTMGNSTGRELNVYLRHTAEITSGFTSTSLLRYRESTLQSTALTSDTATAVTLINANSPSSAVEARQDFDLNTRQGLLLRKDQLGVAFGLRYQHADLPGGINGANVTSSSTWAPGAAPYQTGKIGPDQIAYAPVPSAATDQLGLYLYTKYAFNPHHALSCVPRR